MSYSESIRSFGYAGESAPGRSVSKEALAVGIIMVIIFALIHIPMMRHDPTFSMSHAGIFLGVFLTGALGHLAFEAAGLNRKFCDDAYGKMA
jgi:hypothetical protein